eukprot:TRINITY_DN6014_c0_g2_i1.p2 TRINITY_DN6014_c0_g2~~TRINITY_DN6014_c0_g2_i1.p2  ORF type:complete len:187 (+),score=18.33 TRINITY_DN6014_c0_g2_i1:288-848(+)
MAIHTAKSATTKASVLPAAIVPKQPNSSNSDRAEQNAKSSFFFILFYFILLFSFRSYPLVFCFVFSLLTHTLLHTLTQALVRQLEVELGAPRGDEDIDDTGDVVAEVEHQRDVCSLVGAEGAVERRALVGLPQDASQVLSAPADVHRRLREVVDAVVAASLASFGWCIFIMGVVVTESVVLYAASA